MRRWIKRILGMAGRIRKTNFSSPSSKTGGACGAAGDLCLIKDNRVVRFVAIQNKPVMVILRDATGLETETDMTEYLKGIAVPAVCAGYLPVEVQAGIYERTGRL